MNISLLSLIIALITGWLYTRQFHLITTNNTTSSPTVIALLSVTRMLCMGVFLYLLLNSSPIHSILMVIIFGAIVWIKR